MKDWIKMVCGACGLVPMKDEENALSSMPLTSSSSNSSSPAADALTTTTTTSTTTDQEAGFQPQISSPYILISECYTGARASKNEHIHPNSTTSESSRKLSYANSLKNDPIVLPLHFKGSPPPLRGATIASQLPGPEEVRVSTLILDHKTDLIVLPPERPPKPAHLAHFNPTPPSVGFDNYANSSDMQRIYSLEANNNNNNNNNNIGFSAQTSESHGYLPPSVSRALKPGRKGSGSMRVVGSASHRAQTNFATLGPPVERALKPKNSVMSTMPRSVQSYSRSSSVRLRDNFLPFAVGDNNQSSPDEGSNSDESLSRRHSIEDEQIYFYMPPVNTTSSNGTKIFPLMIPADSFEHPSVAYIDLDLPKPEDDDVTTSFSGSTFGGAPFSNHHNTSKRSIKPFHNTDHSSTIYKTIDIEKTEAFNRTKRDIENQRQKTDAHSK